MIFPPIKVGFTEDEPSYCSSRKRPALEAVGVVTDFVVVKVSKTKAAKESLEESGVDEKDRKEDNRCERRVVFPEPLSPLKPWVRYFRIPLNWRVPWDDLQEYHCLVFSTRSQPSKSTTG
jgi:hypothetical protein